MILVSYHRTMAGAAQRAAERARTLPVALEAPKVQPEPEPLPVAAIEPPRVVRMPLTPFQERRLIISLVARMHRSTYAWVLSPSRKPKHVTARQAALCAVAEFNAISGHDMTLNKLGSLANRDHSTVVAAFRKRGYQERR